MPFPFIIRRDVRSPTVSFRAGTQKRHSKGVRLAVMIGQNQSISSLRITNAHRSSSFCLAPPSPPFAAATAREHVPRRAVVLHLQSQARRTSRASRWCVCDSFSLDRHGMGSHDDGFRRSRAITRARASRDARVALNAIRSIDSRAVAREREGRRAILEGRATDDDRC